MKNRRILIALEQLGVGGIETFVLNQVKALKRKNIDVYLLAKKGLYYDQFKKNGAKIIEYEIKDCIYFNKNNIKKMSKILINNKIDEVHINQFPFMSVLMPACIMTNTPYVAYLHMASGIINDPVYNAYDYFERQFITYNKIFKMFFKNASKIVAITEDIKNHTQKRYSIDKNKIIVRPNAIDLKDYSTNKKVKRIKKVFLLSRISIEKKNVIINAIKLYQKLKEYDKDITLTIAGDGNLRQDIEEYISNQKITDITMLGNISNVKEVMEKYDLVIAVDRCILEALCLNKLSVISGYSDIKGLVTNKNIYSCIKENFCGNNQKTQTIDKVANIIMNLSPKEIEEITKSNHKIIEDKLDIDKNIFVLEDTKINYNRDEYIEDLLEISEIIGESQIEYYNKAEEIWKTYKNYEVYINKRYGFYESIYRFMGRIKGSIKRRVFKKKKPKKKKRNK